MRKFLGLSALFFILVLIFTACAAPDDPAADTSDEPSLGEATHVPSLNDIPPAVFRESGNDSVGYTYVYEGEGFPDKFAITLFEDGTFSYYEGMLSSYIGFGTWEETDGIVTLTTSSGYGLVHRFRREEKALVFITEGSDNFIYVKVADGEKFLLYSEE